MTDRELFIFTIADETPRFEKVFQAIPKEHRDYRPDPKSKTAMELAANMVGEAATLSELLQKGSFDFALLKRPEDKEPEEIAKLFTETLTEARKNASTMSDEDWRTEAIMLMSGHEGWKTSRGAMVFSLLLDLIHHRGQLSTYLRAMGGKVPAIYGPSADEAD